MSDRLHLIQFMKNKIYHSEINRSPYEAMFGCKVKVGINTYLSLDSTEIHTEEKLKMILNENVNQVDNVHQDDNNIQLTKETSIYNIETLMNMETVASSITKTKKK